MISTEVGTRNSRPEDKDFIFTTWKQGVYHGQNQSCPNCKDENQKPTQIKSLWFDSIPKDLFLDAYQKVIERILLRPHVKIKIACALEDPNVILGYCVTEEKENKTLLHWVFVKPAFRKLGIAKALLPPKIDILTHLTTTMFHVKQKESIFNPFLI